MVLNLDSVQFNFSRQVAQTSECRTYHAVDADEVFRAFCPWRQYNVTKWLAIIVSSEVVAIAIGEHIRQVEKLRN